MSTKDGNLEQTLARLESIQEEVRPDRELSWRAIDSCDNAFRVAWRTALMGAVPTLLLVAVLAIMHIAPVERVLGSAVNVATLVGCGVLYVLAVGFVSGRVAHRFAYETNVSAPTLAMLIAWVANLSLWGWAAVLVIVLLNRP
ncbi:MAG: hypothetical protein H7062_12605 [Candidatus Saccharimonas sp.]|nr:hypothetical protein [Planctomycetaceae bacterium]